MTPSLVESQILNEMAGALYAFLPGSGNNNFSFPLAAAQAGVPEFWVAGSKRPAILRLLEATLSQRRNRFCSLILAVVRLSMGWRSGRGEPLTIREIDLLNALLLRLEFKIPELHTRQFRDGLSGSSQPVAPPTPAIDMHQVEGLIRALIDISLLEPAPRGYAFEKFLSDTFALFDLAPRGAFRLVGEQIDGSFHLHGETYLLEAKWQGQQIGNRELQSFAGTVRTKSQWSRGLYISYSGFTADGLAAFSQGAATPIICMTGAELWQTLEHKLHLPDVLAMKTRRAAETGKAFIELQSLYPDIQSAHSIT